MPEVKAVSIKLSQGAKPGLGGVLPGAKVTPEIAETRGVPVGETVVSPPAHTAFTTPLELTHFIATLRSLSGGKPVGFKLCAGARTEIAVDGRTDDREFATRGDNFAVSHHGAIGRRDHHRRRLLGRRRRRDAKRAKQGGGRRHDGSAQARVCTRRRRGLPVDLHHLSLLDGPE